MKKNYILILFTFFVVNLFSQDDLYSLMRERNEYYFGFELNDNYDIKELSTIVSIDKINDDRVVAYANAEQYERIISLGIKTSLLTPPSMLVEYDMYDNKCREEYSWDQYPTYESYESMMYDFAERFPEKCSITELGVLESGRKILVARINDGVIENKPKFLYVSTIHGDETTGFMLLLRLIDYLLTNEELPEVRNVMDNLDIFICPNVNPDGTYYSGNHTVYGSRRYNADGIDLNRNYPDYKNGSHPDGNEYAPETEMLMQFAEEHQFTMSATYHGGAELINYPWDNDYKRHVDDEWWQYVSREYADLAQVVNNNYMTDMNDGITNGADWYVINGSRQDYMNYYQQCREVTIECSLQKCPPAYEMPDFWSYNINSIFAYMNQCINGIHGKVIDSYTKNAVEATIKILDHDEDYSVVKTQLPYGDFHRPIKAGEYIVMIESKGYTTVYDTVSVDDGGRIDLNVEMLTEESYTMKDTTIVTCNAYFYDSGGDDDNYSDNELSVITFRPSAKGAMIQIEFLEFATEENNDILKVYDGKSVVDSECVATLSGSSLPEIITATNLEGSITLSFSSDIATNDSGWKAIVRCTDPVDVDEYHCNDMVSIYPNPTKDVIVVESDTGDKISNWILYNTQGQIVMRSYKEDALSNIEVTNLKKGLYFLSIVIEDKQIVEKVVIE